MKYYGKILFNFFTENIESIKNCYLADLNDLNGGTEYVREKVAEYANDLLGLCTDILENNTMLIIMQNRLL